MAHPDAHGAPQVQPRRIRRGHSTMTACRPPPRCCCTASPAARRRCGASGSGWPVLGTRGRPGGNSGTAARRPGWPGRLVLVDPAWRLTTTDEAAAVKREELAALDRDAGEIRAAYSAWGERDGEAKVREVARVWRPAVGGIIDANLDADLLDAARSLAVPTLVICGDPEAGGAVTHADGDAVASANPNVRLVRIAGAGHNPHRDDPEAVRRALLGWLAVPR